MNSRIRGVVCLVAAAALFLCVPLTAGAVSRKSAASPKAPQVPQVYGVAALAVDPLEASPFYGDLDSDGFPCQQAYVHLDAGDQSSSRRAATQMGVHVGLLPPTATSVDDEFVAWGGEDTSNLSYLHYVAGVYWQHTPAVSDTYDVMVKAYMSNLSAPTTVYRSRTFTVSGIIKPKHASGAACPILLKVERRRSNGSYYVYKTVKTRGYGYSGHTKYVAKISLPYAGTWRARGYHPENPITAVNGNAASYSSYRTVKAR